ncbi:endonuclease III [Kibdelosporangium banguiense]|uniref:Endonuclease III n=1 Tax=Kibdelosporangium banguiense TaxID=1365924 RepID=A0ABS4TW41_9PSEU|nr:endonuclease [Kibdelosporangium banguiense]MBP2328626.1 endonuclease III [Kibdelosporangium banguiense]
MTDQKQIARRLLDVAGDTYASQASIRLADKPSPLYRLLVLSVLLSTRIKADIAVAAAHELAKAKMTTPRKMLNATWQQRVDALGRAHYVRYDESTATALGEGAQLLLDKYSGDLRKLRKAADGDVDKIRALLQEIPRLGPVGAHIFCREVQGVWPELRPYLDRKALDGAAKVGLTADRGRLARLAGDDPARLAAGLVRVGLDRRLAKEVQQSAS